MKKCISCDKELPIGEFYVHPKMGDGHLNKCKTCCKLQAAQREKILRQDSDWVKSERARGREKYHRLGCHKPSKEEKRMTMDRYKLKYPEKQLAKNSSQHIRVKVKGNHMHHWSYNKEHWKDVVELTVKEHNLLHRHIIYDQERMMYRRADNNELLDTKEAHMKYFIQL